MKAQEFVVEQNEPTTFAKNMFDQIASRFPEIDPDSPGAEQRYYNANARYYDGKIEKVKDQLRDPKYRIMWGSLQNQLESYLERKNKDADYISRFYGKPSTVYGDPRKKQTSTGGRNTTTSNTPDPQARTTAQQTYKPETPQEARQIKQQVTSAQRRQSKVNRLANSANKKIDNIGGKNPLFSLIAVPLVVGNYVRILEDWHSYLLGVHRIKDSKNPVPCDNPNYSINRDGFVDLNFNNKGRKATLIKADVKINDRWFMLPGQTAVSDVTRPLRDKLPPDGISIPIGPDIEPLYLIPARNEFIERSPFTERISEELFATIPTLLVGTVMGITIIRGIALAVSGVLAGSGVGIFAGIITAIVSVGVGWLLTMVINKFIKEFQADEKGKMITEPMAAMIMKEFGSNEYIDFVCSTRANEAAESDADIIDNDTGDKIRDIDFASVIDQGTAIEIDGMFENVITELQEELTGKKLRTLEQIMKEVQRAA